MSFSNGLMLTYLKSLAFSPTAILLILSLPVVFSMTFVVPLAYIADRKGKRIMGLGGHAVSAAGFALIALAAFLPQGAARLVTLAGIMVFGTGTTMYLSSWYALIKPIIPADIRGRFFGIMRVAWMSSTAVLAVAAVGILRYNSSRPVLGGIFIGAALLMILRVVFFARIPEVEPPRAAPGQFGAKLAYVLRAPGYLPFFAYVFLLSLFTSAIPFILGLLETDVLRFNAALVVLMGILLTAGAIAGYFASGRMVDRYGTKAVFLGCHFAYGIVLFLFMLRGAAPVAVIPFLMGGLTFVFGYVTAASDIAISTEMLVLMPAENTSLATSVGQALRSAGGAVAGVLAGQILRLGCLKEQWELAGMTMSQYDVLLLGCGVMVFLLVVTLGLIPSVISRAQIFPGGQ